VAVVDDVAYSPLNGTVQYSLSNAGTLAYRRARSPNRRLLWMESVRSGATAAKRRRRVPGSADVAGRHAASCWTSATERSRTSGIYALARDAITRLTFYADNDVSPIWSADGQRIAYSSWQPDVGTFNLFLVRADGSGEPQRLTTSKNRQNPIAWHPGGKYLLFSEDSHATEGISCCCRLSGEPAATVKRVRRTVPHDVGQRGGRAVLAGRKVDRLHVR
jgi:hypothetical protein